MLLTTMNETYCKRCGDPLDQDCMGNERCPACDGPCPCCDDGGGPGTEDARTRTLERLDEIEEELSMLRRDYEGNARCSEQHVAVWSAIHNRESERAMLEATL
jgi:hypothetical protein